MKTVESVRERTGRVGAAELRSAPVKGRSPAIKSASIPKPNHNPLARFETRTPVRTRTPVKPGTPVKTKPKTAKAAAVAKTAVKPAARVRKPVAVRRHRERLAKFDIPLFLIILVLLVFGLIMLQSASSSLGMREYDDANHFITRQLFFVGFGVAAMIFISFIPYRIFLNKYVFGGLIGLTVGLMGMVMINGIGQGGAVRWINLFGTEFQPSEILKYSLIVALAYLVHRAPTFLQDYGCTFKNPKNKFALWWGRILFIFRLKGFAGFVAFGMVIGCACGLTLLQDHLSATVILGAIGMVMMIASPVKFRYVVVLGIIVAIAASIIIIPMLQTSDSYTSSRIQSWVDPESDVTGVTMQTYQSLVTIGSGGWFGLGLGSSRQKNAFLPVSHNDFIFSVVCEELGFIGGVLVMMLFLVFIMRGFYIARHARDRFGMMLAVGITAQVGIQALLNIAVATNTVPNTGILLPFFSYGGTAMVMLLLQMGVLLNVSRKATIE